ncbi:MULTISPECIES: hypothetical protein [Pseudomonas]|uniref:hypothetical protein n=1 Tax=Pseudomonas TaxID=286 RepID=UPI0014756E23|nr:MULTISPECIES: hypothetical protein [Pseudomonas]NNA56662.1 hypothetical protein [Pseudomonas koreensis]
MKTALTALLLCSALCFAAIASALPAIKEGDIWAYKTRAGEEASTVTILKIENYPHYGTVVHIRVDGIRMTNPVTGGEFNEMPHLPFQAAALQRSLTRRLGETAQIPDFSQGYTYWKAAFDERKGGAFKISVRKTLDGLLSGNWEMTDDETAKTTSKP